MIDWSKKFFIGLFVVLSIFFVSYSDATYSVHTVGAYVGSTYQVSVLDQGNVITIYDNIDKAVFSPTGSPTFYWDSDGNANLIAPSFFDCQNQSQFNYYYLCDEIPDNNFTNITNCSKESIDSSFLSSFLGSINSSDNWAYELNNGGNDYYNFNICFSSKQYSQSLCYFYTANQGYNQWCYQGGDMTGDKLNYNFDSIPIDIIGNSPGVGGGNQNIKIPSSTGLDSYTYIEIGSGDYIDYFEQKEHFTEDICYIGTKDLNSNFEDRIPYYQGTGYTIFDAYSNLYNTNSLTINKVGLFLNMIYANYRSWFLGYNRDSNGNVIYNMIYSGGSIELDYSTGLVNPFLNNKAYLYFIGSTALQTPNIDVYVAGQDVALYCYYKLNNYSNDGENYTVNDDYDHKGLDQRVAVNSKNNRTQKTFYTGANEIVGKSRDGTPLEYFQQGSGFIDPSDFFNENFNKFKEVLTPLSPGDLGLGYLPGYIVMFMCALILFRFLGH